MRKKILLLACASLTLLTSLQPEALKLVKADSNGLRYVNNAYQMHEVQDDVTNFFLTESIYNSSNKRIQLKNSIRLKRPETGELSIHLIFDRSPQSLFSGGHVSLYFVNDENSVIASVNKTFGNANQFTQLAGDISPIYGSYNITFQIDVDDFPDYFTLCGNEYTSSLKSFYIEFTEPINIEQFAMEPRIITDTDYIPFPTTYGIAPGSQKVYNNGSSYDLEIDYDNRLTVNDIIKNIIAYDYSDDKEVEKEIDDDTYSEALYENLLGEFFITISAQDNAKNKSFLTINTTIVDNTAPVIDGPTNLVVPYTDLSSDNTFDLTKDYRGNDNYDQDSRLVTTSTQVELWKDNYITLTARDSSGNTSSKNIVLTVIDDVKPTITGSNELSFYQFEIKDDEQLLKNFTFDDGNGSGVFETGIDITHGKCDYGKAGTYPITIFCKDKYNNISTYNATIIIKDGVGPVFFIKEINLSLTTSTLSSAKEIVKLAKQQNLISKVEYDECKFIDNNYVDNYNNLGEYETKIVCYKEDGTRDYYIFTLKVEKVYEKNPFKRFLNSIQDFFNRIKLFFKYIWKAITNTRF